MNRLPFIVILLVVFAACNKSHSTIQPATTQPATTIKYPTAKLNGNLIWIGTAGEVGDWPYAPDAFERMNLSVLNDSVILVANDTFIYSKFDTANHVVEYNALHNPGVYSYLSYYTDDNSMEYETTNNGGGARLNTKYYKPNSSLRAYMPYITGPKHLSGMVYDTLPRRVPNRTDTSYLVDTTINFTAIDDSTIAVDKDFLNIRDSVLHYKETNESEKTVIFQNFHSSIFMISTLTYNYETKGITFQQEYNYVLWHRVLKMQ